MTICSCLEPCAFVVQGHDGTRTVKHDRCGRCGGSTPVVLGPRDLPTASQLGDVNRQLDSLFGERQVVPRVDPFGRVGPSFPYDLTAKGYPPRGFRCAR